jgi:hypothetical protein
MPVGAGSRRWSSRAFFQRIVERVQVKAVQPKRTDTVQSVKGAISAATLAVALQPPSRSNSSIELARSAFAELSNEGPSNKSRWRSSARSARSATPLSAICATGCAGWSWVRTLAFARRCTECGIAELTAPTAPLARSPTSCRSHPPRQHAPPANGRRFLFSPHLISRNPSCEPRRNHGRVGPHANPTPPARMWATCGATPANRWAASSSRSSADQSTKARRSP